MQRLRRCLLCFIHPKRLHGFGISPRVLSQWLTTAPLFSLNVICKRTRWLGYKVNTKLHAAASCGVRAQLRIRSEDRAERIHALHWTTLHPHPDHHHLLSTAERLNSYQPHTPTLTLQQESLSHGPHAASASDKQQRSSPGSRSLKLLRWFYFFCTQYKDVCLSFKRRIEWWVRQAARTKTGAIKSRSTHHSFCGIIMHEL